MACRQVPGCVHLDLRRHGLIANLFRGSNELDLQWSERANWTYRTSFDMETVVRAVDGEAGVFEIEFHSTVFQHRVKWEIAGLKYRASDHFFDLHPHWPHKVRVRLLSADAVSTAEELKAKITTLSLTETY